MVEVILSTFLNPSIADFFYLNCIICILMKKCVLYIVFLFSSIGCFGQTYIPMPADSAAAWRYRINDADGPVVNILDQILFLNGQDTIANGNTYHKIMSRSRLQTGGPGFDPPVINTDANASDIFYGAMREAGMQVFLLDGSGEDLMYDFTVGVGDSIPAYVGKDRVTAIDSVLINGVYHKRFLTTDTTWFVIEGIGSNRGLITDLNGGDGSVIFYCFTDTPVTWSPDTTLPCTYVYPLGYSLAVSNANHPQPDINIYPVPASDVLHISVTGQSLFNTVILNDVGQVIWSGIVNDGSAIPVGSWPKGVYFFHAAGVNAIPVVKNIVIE
jgi:hypothetical protein